MSDGVVRYRFCGGPRGEWREKHGLRICAGISGPNTWFVTINEFQWRNYVRRDECPTREAAARRTFLMIHLALSNPQKYIESSVASAEKRGQKGGHLRQVEKRAQIFIKGAEELQRHLREKLDKTIRALLNEISLEL